MVEALAVWVKDEYANKRGKEVDTAHWPRRYERRIPEQHNGWDCGVFTLQVGSAIAHRNQLSAALQQYRRDIPEQHNGWYCGMFTLQVELTVDSM